MPFGDFECIDATDIDMGSPTTPQSAWENRFPSLYFVLRTARGTGRWNSTALGQTCVCPKAASAAKYGPQRLLLDFRGKVDRHSHQNMRHMYARNYAPAQQRSEDCKRLANEAFLVTNMYPNADFARNKQWSWSSGPFYKVMTCTQYHLGSILKVSYSLAGVAQDTLPPLGGSVSSYFRAMEPSSFSRTVGRIGILFGEISRPYIRPMEAAEIEMLKLYITALDPDGSRTKVRTPSHCLLCPH